MQEKAAAAAAEAQAHQVEAEQQARAAAAAAAQRQQQEAAQMSEAAAAAAKHPEQPHADVAHEAPQERNWKSTDHWLPPREPPKVTVVGEKPRGWPTGAAFPALPPPNIFRGQG